VRFDEALAFEIIEPAVDHFRRGQDPLRDRGRRRRPRFRCVEKKERARSRSRSSGGASPASARRGWTNAQPLVNRICHAGLWRSSAYLPSRLKLTRRSTFAFGPAGRVHRAGGLACARRLHAARSVPVSCSA
jgi:hypothetical protein